MRVNIHFDKFINELNKKGKLELNEICSFLCVSSSTARRLCVQAEQKGMGIRLHGGAIQSAKFFSPKINYLIEDKMSENVKEKQAIGKYASTLVESNDIIYVSSGTTTLQFMLYLAERVNAGEIHNVCVMTNSLRFVELSSDALQIVLTGGNYRRERQDFAGEIARASIESARFIKCFIGTDGIELPEGIIASDEETLSLDRIAVSRSDFAFILADYSKFNSRSYIRFQPLLSKHVIITDRNIHESHLRLAAECGISLKVVDVNT